MRHLIHGLTLLLYLLIAPAVSAQEPYFQIDSLNAGLPTPPDVINRRTAYGAMASFLDQIGPGP
ncbi:hypothetical protein LCGC14_3080440 [marine sediment metagenome]|uniref:Uncharacterized protein n=1 Tax=marine sediment metagenome TaxID=412755 RepID=A0A0F8Z495_9ZZZZ